MDIFSKLSTIGTVVGDFNDYSFEIRFADDTVFRIPYAEIYPTSIAINIVKSTESDSRERIEELLDMAIEETLSSFVVKQD